MYDDEIKEFLCPNYTEEIQEYKEEKPGLFDYINDITYNKNNLLYEEKEKNGVFPKEFSTYMAIKTLGNNIDTLLFANEMNKYFEIPQEIQYLFYLYGIPKKKRFAKFYSIDNEKEEKIKALCKYFNWGYRESSINIKMFSDDEINEIIRRINNERVEKQKTRKRK